jgi:hypothetical protein
MGIARAAATRYGTEVGDWLHRKVGALFDAEVEAKSVCRQWIQAPTQPKHDRRREYTEL